MGVYGDAVAPDGSQYYPYYGMQISAPRVYSQSDFANSAVVGSTNNAVGQHLLPAGTPVQLAVTVGFDGTVLLGARDFYKAATSMDGFTAGIDAGGTFQLSDPSITYFADGYPEPVTLVDFQASVYGTNSGYIDPLKGFIPEQYYNASWSLTNDAGANLYRDTSYSCDGATPGVHCGLAFGTAGGFNGSPLDFQYATGLQTVTLDTRVGETLNWSGSLDVLNQAYGATASSYGDFSHTLAVNLTPITSGVTLQFAYPQQPLLQNNTVPDPPTSTLLGAGLLAACAARKRKRRATE